MNTRFSFFKSFISLMLCSAMIPGLCACAQNSPEGNEQSPAAVEETAKPKTDYGRVIINEFMEKNKSVLRDSAGEFPDWIELYNPGNRSIDISGWGLSDGEDKEVWIIENAQIGAGEYLLIFADGMNIQNDELHTSFSISGDERICLYSPDGELEDSAAAGNCKSDVSMALDASGEWQKSKQPTPGRENTEEAYESLVQSMSAAGPLVINEVVTYNTSFIYDYYIGACDWVEIKNISSEPVNTADWYLSDDDKNLQLFNLPDFELEPGMMLMVLCCGGQKPAQTRVCYAPFELDASNERLYLSSSEGLADYVGLREIPANCSYGRLDGQDGWFYFRTPSFNADNTDGRRSIAPMPVSLKPDGVFNDVKAVTAELSGEGTIHYTLNGAEPDASSPVYDGPIEITKTCVLRAKVITDDMIPSRTLTLSYIINENHELPVVSLATDNPWAFGLMYEDGDKTQEQTGNLAFYRDGSSFSIPCGIKMNGATSLVMPKKNMALRFRDVYGQGELDYDIFGGGVTRFTNLLLRAGQDQGQSIIINELAQRLCSMATDNVINQRAIYCVLYVNGEYFGIYNLMEKANEQLYASIAGVSKGSVELLEATVPYNSELSMEVMEYPFTHDMTTEEAYEHVASYMNMDSLIDWLIIEGYCGNTDLSSGNLRYARSKEADGKWHLMFYDLDAAFRSNEVYFSNVMQDGVSSYMQIAQLVNPLMKNERFKDEFLTRAAELMDEPLNDETVLALIDSMVAELEPEVSRDAEKYGRTYRTWQWNLEHLVSLITDGGWHQGALDSVCRVFGLTDAERTQYFGAIDWK